MAFEVFIDDDCIRDERCPVSGALVSFEGNGIRGLKVQKLKGHIIGLYKQ